MSSYYQIAVTRDFYQQLHSLDRSIFLKWQRVGQMIYKDPFHPTLNAELIKQAQPGVYSARLDDNYRIIFRYIKPDCILLFWVDKHDPAYRKAMRTVVTIEDSKVKVLETIETKTETTTQWMAQYHRPTGQLFARWSDEELLKCGLSTDWLPGVRQMNDLNDFDLASGQIPEDVFDALFSLILEAEEPTTGTHVSDTQLKIALSQPQTREDIHVFESDQEFEKALAGSLLEWMLFLHPSQRQLVEMNVNGPARIKGGAGSGKTVVALHRARYLAGKMSAEHSGSKVLFLTFNNRLAAVVTELLKRLCNDEEFWRIEVKTLHQWCAGFLRNRCFVNLDKAEDIQITNILDMAILQTRGVFPSSKVFDLSRDFIEDEIRYVIKGRALNSFEDYLQLKRTGRGTPLGAEDRQVLYKIYSRYQEALGSRCDWDDFILKSLTHVQRGVSPGMYSAVLVDEVQDFTEAGMRLIGQIAGDGPNRLLLVGDGQQKIYKGGFSLKDLGIAIVGRSRILRNNYRNTKQILQAAYSMVRNAAYDDLEDEEDIASVSPEFPKRLGPKPVLKTFTSKQDEVDWVASQIVQRVRVEHSNVAGDIGVLYLHPRQYGGLIDSILSAHGIQVAELRRDTAHLFFDDGFVKRCTFHSAKGLEFKVVFLVGVTDSVIPGNSPLSGEALDDYLRRERRLLFVVMTRARDALFMSYSEGQPSRFLHDIEPGLLDAA